MDSDLLFDLIETIAAVSSKKHKKNMLVPELKQILEYTYDPFKTYGIKRIPQFRLYGERKKFSEFTWVLLDALVKRKVTGNQARDFTAAYLSTLTPKSAELFQRILLKDLRCGVSTKSINEVFPGLIAEGITMQPMEYESRLIVFPTLASYKLRGVRGYYKVEDNTMYSRRGKPFFGLSHITDALQPFGHDFDGELLVPGMKFEDGAGLIRNRDETPQVHYCIFDAPSGLAFKFRYEYYMNINYMLPTYIVGCQHHHVSEEKFLLQLNEQSLSQGYEGIVCKNPNSLYQPGYNKDWLKMKELQEPIDLEVIDVFEGKGKYSNSLGGVIVIFNNVRVSVGGGFSDLQRDSFWRDPNLIVGHTVEVKYQEVTKDGSLRNPVFLRVRDDK